MNLINLPQSKRTPNALIKKYLLLSEKIKFYILDEKKTYITIAFPTLQLTFHDTVQEKQCINNLEEFLKCKVKNKENFIKKIELIFSKEYLYYILWRRLDSLCEDAALRKDFKASRSYLLDFHLISFISETSPLMAVRRNNQLC